MLREVEQYYLEQKEPVKSCLLAVRSIILNQDAMITETCKWGMPCFCYQKKMFCFLWTDRKTAIPYVLFVDGNQLDHPQLEQGNRSRMKVFHVYPEQDIPVETLVSLLQTALGLYRKKK